MPPISPALIQADRPTDDAAAWPDFPGANLPDPESTSRRVRIRVVALIALTVSLAYLTWRIGWTIQGATLWLAIPLLVCEAHALGSLALHTLDMWQVDAVTPPAGC